MKYQVTAEVTISLNAEVEADTEEEAEQLAAKLEMPSLCWQCAGEQGDESWSTSSEFDGAAENIKVGL